VRREKREVRSEKRGSRKQKNEAKIMSRGNPCGYPVEASRWVAR